MNTLEYLLTTLAEECNELAQVCSKANRFGMDDAYTGITKEEWLTQEFNDILAVIEMLNDEGLNIEPNSDLIEDKIQRVHKFMNESRRKGLLK